MMTMRTACLMLTAAPAVLSRPEYSFDVCGNFCGPGWCNGGWTLEADCDDSSSVEGGESCTDLCCKNHDTCCGHGSDSSHCNTEIVACLDACNPFDASCTMFHVPVFAGGERPMLHPPSYTHSHHHACELTRRLARAAIKQAMHIVDSWCCGQPCDSTDDVQRNASGEQKRVSGNHSLK